MSLTFFHFALYIGVTWGTNITFNLLYVLKSLVPSLAPYDLPIDARKMLSDNHRLFGDSTTVPGLVVAVVLAIFVSRTSYAMFSSVPLLVYAGHLIGSFIKRRLGKPDGYFVPFIDHGDYMLVSGVVLVLQGTISLPLALAGLLFTYIAHPMATLLAFRLGIRKYPY